MGGCFGKGCLVSFGHDFVGDHYSSLNTPTPSSDPLDCDGHGTFVAGIIAAQGTDRGLKGAAPGVTLGSYRVIGCSRKTTSDILMAAWNKAYEDGAQIITSSVLSIGGWSQSPLSRLVSNIAAKGVLCVVSAGKGVGLPFNIGDPAAGEGVITVGAITNTEIPTAMYQVEYSIDHGTQVDFQFLPGKPDDWNVTMDLYATSLDDSPEDACNTLPDSTPDLSNKIVLLRQGTCSFSTKIENAAKKKARYFLTYNIGPEMSTVEYKNKKEGSKAVGSLKSDVGYTLRDYLAAGRQVTVKIEGNWRSRIVIESVPNKVTGDHVTHTTAWGPTWDMHFKPQFCAVGENVLSTYPRQLGGYAVLTDSSMAASMAAGVIALIAEVRKTFDPALITSLLSATAMPKLYRSFNIPFNYTSTAVSQGGGLIQAYNAAYATTVIRPSSLSFNDTANFIKSLDFTIKNDGKKEIFYKFSNVGSPTTYLVAFEPQSVPTVQHDPSLPQAGIKFSQQSIRLGPGQSASITVSPTPPKGIDSRHLPVWAGYIAINGSDGTALSLPYQGLAASLYDAENLQLVEVAKLHDGYFYPIDEEQPWVFPGSGSAKVKSDLYLLSYHLIGSPLIRHYVERMDLEVEKEQSKAQEESISEVFGSPFAYRPTNRVQNAWDGRLSSGEYAPAGKYRFIARSLRIFGDDKREEDWVSKTSSTFEIQYQKA